MLEEVKGILGQGWVGGLLGVVGLVVALVSIVLAVYFYRRSQRVPKLNHYMHGFQVAGGPRIDAAGEHLEVRFKGEAVHRLDIAWIAVWNGGTGTLDSSALVSHEPLRIQISEDGELLEASIIRVARDVNMIRLGPMSDDKRFITMTFDYLDPGDGVLVKVLHTSTAGTSPTLAGVLKGTSISPIRAPQIQNLRYPKRKYSEVQSAIWLLMAAILLVTGLMPNSVVSYIDSFVPPRQPGGGMPLFIRVLYISMAALQFGFWLIWRRERRPPVPIALRTPEDESDPKTKVAARVTNSVVKEILRVFT